MPGQTAAAHGACRSGGVFPQYSSLWSGVLPRVSENPDGAATRKYFPASRFRRSVMQWDYLNRRMNRFFLARLVFSLMLGAPDRPHDAMTGPGLISLFCFLITAAYFLRGGMCAGIVLCMGLAFFSFSRRGWLRRSVTFLLQVSLLFWGAEAWRLARLWMMEGGAFPALDFHSGCRAVAPCGGHSMAEARRKEFARPGAGPQPRIFRFRIASVFAGCAGSFPFADGGAHLAVAGG